MNCLQTDVGELWKRYRSDKSTAARNDLITHYLPLVRSVAERLHARLPREIDVDDLMSDGIFGLMRTIESFDLDRGVSFETFSSPRIKGAMLDHLRQLDWVPRLVRLRQHQLNDARREFEIKHGVAPTDEELADYLCISSEEFQEMAKSAAARPVLPLDRQCSGSDSSDFARQIDFIADPHSGDPSEAMQRDDLRALVTRGMTRMERLVTILYYYEEMTMHEIGQVLNISESRVSQMHSGIILRIQKLLCHRHGEFVS